MYKINKFVNKYGELVWVVLMGTLCIADICVLSIEWNFWSFVGAICCGISAVLNCIFFVIKEKNFQE